ncbi:MAG: NAD-dependent epimerase/dehydratase family protein [Kiloniellales bacterium]
MRILVTGASGFIGRVLVRRLAEAGHRPIAATRGPTLPELECRSVGELGPGTDWSAALEGADMVVHLAARAHLMRDPAPDPAAAYHTANVAGTRCLAEAAARVGLGRLVFLSTAKVHGEATPPNRPFQDADPAAPRDPYAVSKWQAERALAEVAADTRLEVVVLRSPLVYGPGVRANFRALLRLCDGPWPLPFGGVDNRRSLIFVDNLADAVRRALEHPAAAGGSFLVSDAEAMSTPALIRRLRQGLGRPARLLAVPPASLRLVGRLPGAGAAIDRLTGSLAVDSGGIERALDWRPPVAAEQGLLLTAKAYRTTRR